MVMIKKSSKILMSTEKPMINLSKFALKIGRNIMKKFTQLTSLFVLYILVLTACIPVSRVGGIATSPPEITPQEVQTSPAVREAQVLSVEIQFMQTDPVQVNAIVRGNLSESCATFGDSQLNYSSNTFNIKLLTVSPSDRGCAQVITPYEQTFPLDTSGLKPGTYTVTANGVSTVFTLAAATPEPLTTVHLVVYSSDRTIRIVDANIPLNPTYPPLFNGMLPSGTSAAGIGYVLDTTDKAKVVAVGSNGVVDLNFIKNPTSYGLTVWRGSSDAQLHLGWGTQPTDSTQVSSLMMSSLDGSQLETLLSQDTSNPPIQLVAEFWSADGQWLYFSKEPMGLGGYILFGGASNLYKINISTKEVTELILLTPSSGLQACLDAISADYRYVADHCSQDKISIRDLTSGGTTTILPPADVTGFKFVGSARFSTNGSRLAFALARGDQSNEQGWVAVSDSTSGASKLILTGQAGTYYTVAGWLDDQTLLVQSTKSMECTPYCKSELWSVGIDGSGPQKVADGSLLAVINNDLGAVPQPAATPAPTATTAPVAMGCQDSAQYITDDGLDGTTYGPNVPFTKTWTVKNTGTCTWDSSYMVFQISGAFMTQSPGYWIVPQGQTVSPGQTVNISIGMTSPVENGSYKSYWGLKNAVGEIMPIQGGADGDSFYVILRVSNGQADGEVTATSIDIVPEQGSGEACASNSTYFVHAYITTDGPLTADYEIGSSAGQISAGYFDENGGLTPYVTGRIIFDKADTKSINLRFVGPYPHPDDVTVNLRVNGGEWLNTKLICS
jgi:hypothetical protein